MPGNEISADVRRFIHRTISSVEQLEVLLFLMSNSERGWTAEEVGERIRVASRSANTRMVELHKAQILSLEQSEPPCYRYAPSSSALEKEVAESLDRAYKERRDSLIELIYSRPFENIRIFADAFRIQKEEP